MWPAARPSLPDSAKELLLAGSYTFTYTQQSGSCGAIPPVSETINGGPNAQNLSAACPGGSGTDVAEPGGGGCTITGNFNNCQSTSSGTTFDLVETAVWNASDTSATGTVSIKSWAPALARAPIRSS